MKRLIGLVAIGYLVAFVVGDLLSSEYRLIGLILMGIPVLATFYLLWVRTSKLFSDHPNYRDTKAMQLLMRQNRALDRIEEKLNELQNRIVTWCCRK